MTYVRKNVWELGDDWADPILWYARAVADMKTRPLADPTSWRFYSAIHGIDDDLWRKYKYLNDTDVKPSDDVIAEYWEQCQHATWYFLPWHRGYLLTFEAVVRAAVVRLGGPADWSLPYWNYSKLNQAGLPPGFQSQTWPDGKGPNPLYVVERYGPAGDGNVAVVNATLDPMADHVFIGEYLGGTKGFGGPITDFQNAGNSFGDFENQPHNTVHTDVGGIGRTSRGRGLMTDPDTAALDPIFWLHHANIDRLWEVWRLSSPENLNPTQPKWINGPTGQGNPKFVTPKPDGTAYEYHPGQLTDLTSLGYTYDDLLPVAVPAPSDRLIKLGVSLITAKAFEEQPMVPPGEPELVGASAKGINVVGAGADAQVTLDQAPRKALAMSLQNASLGEQPDRVYLNLENVTAPADGAVFKVYVALKSRQNPKNHPDLLAGTIALFGVRKASKPDGRHAGNGVNYTLDITKIADRLHLDGALDVKQLQVRIVSTESVPANEAVKIGRISIYRQSP